MEARIGLVLEEKHTRGVVEDDDNRDLHGNRVDHVNRSWGSGFGSEIVDEEKECESIDGDGVEELDVGRFATSEDVQSEEQALVTCER